MSIIAESLVSSSAGVLLLDFPSCRTHLEEWPSIALLLLERATSWVVAAVVSAENVGVPSCKAKPFVAGVRSHCHEGDKGQLRVWMARLEQSEGVNISAGDILGQDGTYFVKP